MRRGVVSGACAVLLAGPTVIAFFSGGYFDSPRVWAGLVAWVLVAVAALTLPNPLPRGLPGWLTIAALALFAAWTLLSIVWAPVAGSAYHAGQRIVLYLGVLVAAAALLADPANRRAAEPALAAGALIVIGYAISERLLPGLLHFQRSVSAQGRLEQPLTYWNAMGELAALGFVLCARIAGDRARARPIRAVAAGAAAPLGLGLYLSFSRGALFACFAGLIALVVLAARSEQLQAIVVCVLAGVLAAVAASPSHGVTKLAGSLATRERQGAITFALLAVIVVVAVVAELWLVRRDRDAPLRLPRRAPYIAFATICAVLALAIVIGAKEKAQRPLSSGAARFETLQSNRYAYWRVALRAFGDEPLRGVGAGGWAVYWLKYRTVNEFAQDAHSLPLQTLAELGIVGFVLLGGFFGGVALAGRAALRLAPELAAGPAAGFVVWAVHAPLDWDWEMPAVTLVALVLAGSLIAGARALPAPRAAAGAETHAR